MSKAAPDDLIGRPHVRCRPTVLVGPPGCGKTTFAEAILDALGVRRETYPCGGVSDATLAGTPRRWSTGEPSLPVALVQRWHTASPGIVLDEIEKVGTGARNEKGYAHSATGSEGGDGALFGLSRR